MNRFTLAIVSTVTLGTIIAFCFHSSTSVYGYGYGYGACTASRPHELETEYVNDYERIKLSWEAVVFEDCEDTETSSYRIQVRKEDATLISEYSDLTNTYKKISADGLLSNKVYKFRVKAIASDDEETEWSLYKSFRTRPIKPKHLSVTQTAEHQVRVAWDNVPRSTKLRYYQVKVKRGDRIVFSKHVSLGLRRERDNTTVSGLKTGVEYQVKVRAVARTTSKGPYAKQRFTIR